MFEEEEERPTRLQGGEITSSKRFTEKAQSDAAAFSEDKEG